MPENIKTIGIIGTGSIGRRHWINLTGLGCKPLPHDPAFSLGSEVYDLEHILENSDAFVIASPTVFHYQHLIQCLDRSKPIFVEKPIGCTSIQMEELIDRTGIEKIFVGYNLRFHPCVRKADWWLGEGMIGDPIWATFVCAQRNDKPDYLRDGVILNWSHEIDLALHLLGPALVSGSSTRVRNGSDDMTDILLRHNGGCMTTIHLDYLTQPEQRGFVIKGTEGQIICDLPGRGISLMVGDDTLVEHALFTTSSYDDDYIDEMKAFIEHIDGKETLGATGTEALDVLDICLKVREAAGLSKGK